MEKSMKNKNNKYDFLIVGAGLFGSVCAYELSKKGFKVLVIDKRNHIGGNAYTELKNNIVVHMYGPHIFHTSNKRVWDYINQFATFNNFINTPIANYKGELYNLPFNMNTFVQLWSDVKTPKDAKKRIDLEKTFFYVESPKNLKEQAINLVGTTIFEKLIKGYTEKQWGRKCEELPPDIIKRIPVRMEFNNNYFNDIYQGIPIGGYTPIFEKMLKNIDVKLSYNFISHKKELLQQAKFIIYTGPIDSFFNEKYGHLEYRSLRFETELLNLNYFQSVAVVNYTDFETPFTRIIEHKHFDKNNNDKETIITKEYPLMWRHGEEEFYPINDNKNNLLFEKYIKASKLYPNVFFGGRLGQFKYYDMDKIIEEALKLVEDITR